MSDSELIYALRTRHLIIERHGKLVLTNKLKRLWNKPLILPSDQPVSTGLVRVDTRVDNVRTIAMTYKDMYKEFIKQAEVPSIIDNGNFRYNANRYSKDAEKVFAQIMKDPNINKEALLYSTKLYYKRQDIPRPMIGNYFTKGTWESVYDEFMLSFNEGNIDEFISRNLKEGNGESKYEQSI